MPLSHGRRILRPMNHHASLLVATALDCASLAGPAPRAASPSPACRPPSIGPGRLAVAGVSGRARRPRSRSIRRPLAWTRDRRPTDGPAAREDHTLTVDPDGTAAWLFGGRDGGRVLRRPVAAGPRDRHLAAHRPARRPARRSGSGTRRRGCRALGLVVFGGQAGPTFFDDLWAFDPATGAWSALPGDGRRPEARYGTCAAVGPDGRLWISHGFTASGRFGDTRAWDPVTGRWTVETPADRCRARGSLPPRLPLGARRAAAAVRRPDDRAWRRWATGGRSIRPPDAGREQTGPDPGRPPPVRGRRRTGAHGVAVRWCSTSATGRSTTCGAGTSSRSRGSRWRWPTEPPRPVRAVRRDAHRRPGARPAAAVRRRGSSDGAVGRPVGLAPAGA